tara:strand:- start:42 stop:440 length:399 start_codon:yes stop_codon:yes gene_type:complete
MKKLKIIGIIVLTTINPLAGQNGNTIINKSYKLDSIIKLKKELNSKIQNLRIQIYNGDRTNAELIIKEYIDNFNDTTADIIYETPNYKIWVGNYYTQLEADRNLIKIRKKFSSAFIFRPELIEEMDENQDID